MDTKVYTGVKTQRDIRIRLVITILLLIPILFCSAWIAIHYGRGGNSLNLSNQDCLNIALISAPILAMVMLLQNYVLEVEIDTLCQVIRIKAFYLVFFNRNIEIPFDTMRYTYESVKQGRGMTAMVLSIFFNDQEFKIKEGANNIDIDTLNKLAADLEAITKHPTS